MKGTGKSKPGYEKIRFCAKQTASDDLQFFWGDTCCIDKSSSAELSEAINFMFRWYRNAAKCYAYLSDVSIGGSVGDAPSSQQTWQTAFRRSRWFARGWTIQELIAPIHVEFFSLEGERLGDKMSMLDEIQSITGISFDALEGTPLSRFGVNERMSWATGRKTKREEDAAYSLLGIFDVYMPLIYGEGRRKAFTRLQREVDECWRDRGSDLFEFILQTVTALHETDDTFKFLICDMNKDGRPDLVAIKMSGIGSNRTEVWVLSGASGFQKMTSKIETGHHETTPDLVVIKKNGTGTNSTEVHILSGPFNFQEFILQTGTVLHETDDTFTFGMGK
ncbi:hypothetical protein S40293_03628 [Stachybotrys chartarum IBT 40293]|nr:hypothetical protein S40293_03628 [Stachybotrys chartarum IBT 40293]